MTRNEIQAWVRDNPRAWDGWPTSRGCTDGAETHRRIGRLAGHGLYLSSAAELDAVEDAIAFFRLERRARYRKSVAHGDDL